MRYFFIWLFLVSLIVFRYFTSRPVYNNGQKIRITSVVREEPTRYSLYQKISLAGLKVYLPNYPEIYYGEKVVVEGVVNAGELIDPVLVKKEPSRFFLYKLRAKIVEFYQRSLPEPHASLVGGISLGSKGSLPQDFWEALKSTGTAHVVVASGMNVTMVASFLVGVLVLFIKRRKALIFALVGIWAYVALSGFEAPIIRAAIMGSIAFGAGQLGRVYSAWRALTIAGAAMLLIFPDWAGDLGFILSFVATASLILFQTRVQKAVSFIPGVFREGISTSLAAQIGVAPILFVTFGQFNILSPVINGLILWTIPFIMILGITGGLIGLLIPVAGQAILYLNYPLTLWFSAVINLFS